jgi:hypothetical protein
MLPEIIQKPNIFHVLYLIDKDLAKSTQSNRCPYCSGPLHQAHYYRKARGGPQNIPDDYLIRFSFCCGREQCRKRSISPSCRFLGRKVYWSCSILIILALRQNRPNSMSINKLISMFGVSRKTIKRWIRYFREEFPNTPMWQRLRGRVSSLIKNSELPGKLLSYFLSCSGSQEEGVIKCCQFLTNGL